MTALTRKKCMQSSMLSLTKTDHSNEASKCGINKFAHTLTPLNSHRAEINSNLKLDSKRKFGRGIRKGENKYTGNVET